MNMPAHDEGGRARPRFHLGDLMFLIAALALVLSLLSRAVQTNSAREWAMLHLCLALFAILAAPVVLLGLLVGLAPTTLAGERTMAAHVVKAILLLLLLGFSLLINQR